MDDSKLIQKDLRQSDEYALFFEKIGWQAEKFGQNFAYIKKIPFLGSIIKIHRANPPISFNNLDTLAKKYKSLFVKIEINSPSIKPTPGVGVRNTSPDLLKELKAQKYQLDNWSFSPTKTVVIDLGSSEEAILSSFEKDTRYSIRLAQRKGVKIEESEDIEKFLELFAETAKRKGFWTGSLKEMRIKWEVFKKADKVILLLAYPPPQSEYESEFEKSSPSSTQSQTQSPIAGALIFFYDKVAYYLHAASKNVNRELMAPYLIIWEAVKIAKKRGCKKLDLEGIYDERIPATKNWRGFSHFKKGFGQEVTFLGSFTKFYNPVLKLIFKFGSFF